MPGDNQPAAEGSRRSEAWRRGRADRRPALEEDDADEGQRPETPRRERQRRRADRRHASARRGVEPRRRPIGPGASRMQTAGRCSRCDDDRAAWSSPADGRRTAWRCAGVWSMIQTRRGRRSRSRSRCRRASVAAVGEDDLVARHELVDVAERLVVAGPVTADDDVAELAGHGACPASGRGRGRAWSADRPRTSPVATPISGISIGPSSMTGVDGVRSSGGGTAAAGSACRGVGRGASSWSRSWSCVARCWWSRSSGAPVAAEGSWLAVVPWSLAASSTARPRRSASSQPP